MTNFSKNTQIAIIDLSYISTESIFDVSAGKYQEMWSFRSSGSGIIRAIKDVVRTSEVLIKGNIPAEAVKILSKQ